MRISQLFSALSVLPLLMGVWLVRPACAQSSPNTAGTAKILQGDFAVPDAPALKMLDLTESRLLRPATAKALGAQLASATGDASFIPRAFAIEFSPGLLLRGQTLSIQDYQQHPTLYRLRVSVASKRGDGAAGRSQVAVAIRAGLQDNSDLRTNKKYVNAILALTDWKRDSMLLSRQAQIAAGIPVTTTPTANQQASIDRTVTAELAKRSESAAVLIAAVKSVAEDVEWNASVFDVALGVVSSSADSTVSGPRFDAVAGWVTKGWAIAPHAQLMIGGRGAYERDVTDTSNVNLRATGDAILRLYLGNNAYKFLAEAQGTGRAEGQPKWLASAGGEFQISKLVWITGTAGFQAVGALGKGKLVSAFKVKFNPP